MSKSKSLTIEQNRRQIALTAEASAQTALMEVVSTLNGYQDADGNGPKEDSLKGIMISSARRITLRYGCKIQEMPEPMLYHVQTLKFAMSDALSQMIRRRESYSDIKASLWQMVDQYADEFHRRAAHANAA
jgi:hypothetical protein